MRIWLIWGWVILVIPFFSLSRRISFSCIYIITILMVLTHPWIYIWNSNPEVLILCRATTSFKNVLSKILWGDTISLSNALRYRIYGSQYQHASCIQIGDFTPYWSTSYLCSVFMVAWLWPFYWWENIGFKGRHVYKIRISYKNKEDEFQVNDLCNQGYTYAFLLSNEVVPK